VDANGLPGGGGSGLVHGAFDAVCHESDSRVGSRPSGGDVVGKYECRSPGVISVPAVGDVESASTREHGAKLGPETAFRKSRAVLPDRPPNVPPTGATCGSSSRTAGQPAGRPSALNASWKATMPCG
jgi:hypothetical protein